MKANESLAETMAKSSLYSDYARAYTETTGMPVALRPLETWKLPLHGRCRENPFCAMMAGQSRACAACLQMQGEIAQKAKDQACTVTCAYGLCETAVPVRLGNQTMGFLQTGQVFRKKPTNAQFVRVTEQLEKMEMKVDADELKKAYFDTPVVSQAKMDSATKLLSIFGDYLSLRSNAIAIQQANVEPPVIIRAKKFIMDNLAEELSLAQVAAAVHTSLFYFCKLFRKATGITFTEFVSRSRVEKAKELLLNPNLRVSEIAYEVGFQSLTHFNRTFKAIVGESPTEYRDHLPKAA